MKKVIVVLAVLVMLFCLLSGFAVSAESKIDNSALIPKFRNDQETDWVVTGDMYSPDWIDELMMAEIRIETCTPEGTFASAVKVLDHYAEMGINGLWVTPIHDNPYTDNYTGGGYGGYGPNTVWSKLTGTTDYEEGFKVVKKFVDEAHKRNIRIFFDVVVWGVHKQAPIFEEHREYFSGSEVWGGWGYQWGSKKYQDWYVEACKELILKSGADGLRCDLEPTITGYGVFQRVRDDLYYQNDRKIAIMSEICNDRNLAYDFEQVSIGGNHFYEAIEGIYHEYSNDKWNTVNDEPRSVAECVKSGFCIGTYIGAGTYRWYTMNILCHDDAHRFVRGNLINIGWNAIFLPFIPMWYIGEEWNNPRKSMGGTGVIFFDYIDWEAFEKPENQAFYETVKKYIRIRRTYPEIFQYYPEDHREANICDVKFSGVMTDLSAYARYMDNTAVLVVPNDDINAVNVTVTVPYADMGMDPQKTYVITDLMTGKKIAEGKGSELVKFKSKIDSEGVGVYLVQGPKAAAPTTKPVTKPTTTVPTTTAKPTEPVTTEPVTEPVTEPETQPVTTEPVTEPATEDSSVGETPVNGGAPIGLIVGISASVVVLVAAIVVIVLLRKKKA